MTGSTAATGRRAPDARGAIEHQGMPRLLLVFADLGRLDPDTVLAKADIAGQIAAIIDERGWNRRQASDALGLDQPKVSHLGRGKLRDFSLERLMHLLTRLG